MKISLVRLSIPVLSLSCMSICASVIAGPADYVHMPTVEYGEREFDFKYGRSHGANQTKESAASIGFGVGANRSWFTELYLNYEKEGLEGTRWESIEWENKFQLTETGKYPVDLGLLTEIEVPRAHSDPYEFKWGPLLQTEFGRLQLNGNLLFEHHYRGNESSEPRHTEIAYQWQAKYRWLPAFEYGLQGLGEMGRWNHWSSHNEQNHNVGPAIFGKWDMGGHQAIKYNAAWLFGVSDAAPKHTFRAQIEYEF